MMTEYSPQAVVKNDRTAKKSGPISWALLVVVVLFVSAISLSIKTVVQRHDVRMSFMHLQTLVKERDKLAAKWSSLTLEQGALLNQSKVETFAKSQLGMSRPHLSEVRFVREKLVSARPALPLSGFISSD